MRIAVVVLTHLLAVLAGAATADAQTGQPQVTFGPPGPTTVPMTITWVLAPGATQHVVDGSYNDNTGKFTVTSPTSPVTRPMAYHASGAATNGWVCVTGNIGGNTIPSACNSYTVPAKPTMPPVATTEVFVTFLEPSTNADGTVLKNLAVLRCYWTVDGGPETVASLPPSSPTGALKMTHSVIVPYATGTMRIQVSAVNTVGAESTRSPAITAPLGTVTAPGKGTIGVTNITQ
jgi:hypothetical protein